MGIKRFVKRSVASNLNLKKWADTDGIIAQGKNIKHLLKDALPKKNSVQESGSFESYVTRYNLDEQGLQRIQKRCKQGSYLYALISVALLLYTVHTASSGFLLGTLMCFLLAGVALVWALREQLNAFKIEQKTLQVSIKQWFQSKIKRVK